MRMFLLLTNTFFLLISCFVVGIYCAYHYAVGLHIEYLDIFKVLAFGVLLIIVPSLMRLFLKEEKNGVYIESQSTIIVFFLSVLVGLCSRIVNFDFSSIIIVLGILGLFSGIFIGGKFEFNKLAKDTIFWLIAIFFAIIYAIVITSQYYVINTPTSPLLVERLVIGMRTTDPVYLGGIANIINTYGIPSWGIDGVHYLHYHWGSIWFLTMFANLLHISVIKSYTLLYPAVFVPLMFKALFLFCQQIFNICKSFGFCDKKKLIIFIVIVALAISSLCPFQWQSEIGSDSYSLALFLGFLLGAIFLYMCESTGFFAKISKQGILILVVELPLILFVVGMTKVSVFYDAVLLYFYFVLRAKLYNKITFVGLSILLVLVTNMVYWLAQVDSPVGRIIIHPFYFLHLEMKHQYLHLTFLNQFPIFTYAYSFIIIMEHVFFSYFWTWIFIFSRYFYCKFYQRKELLAGKLNRQVHSKVGMRYFDVEIVIFLFFINALPSYLLKIVGGSNFYFFDITRWISIALFLGVLIKFMCLYSDNTSTEGLSYNR